MRSTLTGAVMALSALAEPVLTQHYLVIPVSRDQAMVRPCRAALSADGNVIAFDSDAALDPTDRNVTTDVYVLDRVQRRVTLASRGLSGGAGRGSSRCPSLSADGQRLVFESDAADLVDGDRNDVSDVFFLDRASGVLRRASDWPDTRLAMSGCASISADGRLAVFHARDLDGPPPPRLRVFRSRLDVAGAPEEIAEGYHPTVSGDGAVVAYLTPARSGVPAALHVREGAVVRVAARPDSHPPDAPAETPMLSADGQWITYVSRATNLLAGRHLSGRAHVYLERLADRRREIVSSTRDGAEANGYSAMPVVDQAGERVVFQSTAANLACDGRRAACTRDINLVADIFLWERTPRTTTRVNGATRELRWLEGSTAPAVSVDGRVATFLSRQPMSDADDGSTFDLFVVRM